MNPIDPLPGTPPAWLQRLVAIGLRLVFYATLTKGPSGAAAVGWTKRADSPADYRDGDNVGTFTGHEVAPGKFLASADFDWAEGLSMVRRLLPATGFGSYRESKKPSQAFYTTPTPLVSKEYIDIDGTNLVELRGAKLDGEIGFQSLIFGVHPNGERVEFKDGDIAHNEHLARDIRNLAIAFMLRKHLGDRAFNHETRLSAAGFLLGAGLPADEVISIGEAVAEVSGNDIHDVAQTVRSTVARLKSGERNTSKSALARAIGEDGKKVVARIKEWLGGSEFLTDAKDNIRANSQDNIRRALDKLEVGLSFDVFAQRPLIKYNGYDGTLQDVVVNRIRLEIETQFNFLPTKEHFFDIVQDLAHKNPFHPVTDYLRGLTWDGVPRLDEWLITCAKAADTAYTKAVSSLVLIAAVRRVMQPGCKFDEMIVLESGTQGLLKSTALRKLCPNETWFSDDLPLNVEAKEIVERTLGKWILEAAELSGMRPASVENLKAMLARQVDGPVRMAYARLPVEQRRQFIVLGTTNSYSYLLDSTGNRRFWPVRVEKFDIEWICANRDQLWAEAVCREQAGASIRLPEHLYADAELQQERRRLSDEWEPVLAERFDGDYQRVGPNEVFETLGISIERRTDAVSRRVSQVMQRLGFVRKTVVDHKGKRVWGWSRGRKLTDSEDEGKSGS